MEPWNTCAQNMTLIKHDLKDKWILDSGATNHMTGKPELLDGTTMINKWAYSAQYTDQ